MKPISELPGSSTSEVEVTNISSHGLWLYLNGQEAFLSFVDFPWFRDATIAQIIKVKRPSPDHLYWSELDVDLNLESIFHTERFPLISRVRNVRKSE